MSSAFRRYLTHLLPPHSFLTNLVAPYLPITAQDYLRAVDPLLSLISNPAALLWTAYSNPQRLLTVLGQTGHNLYTVSRDLDIASIISDVEHRFREGSIQGLAPLFIGAFAIFLTFRTLMSTFRSGFRLAGTLVRYGSFISLLIAAVGWFTGGQQGNQAGLADMLGGFAGNGNANANGGGGGMANGIFNMAKNYATGANGHQAGAGWIWDQAQGLFANVMEGQQQQAPKTGARYNTRSAKQRSNTAGAAGSTKDSAPAAVDENLSDIAQGWVKDALLKASGLDSFFGGNAAKQKTKGKKHEGRPGTEGRRAGTR